MKNTGLLIVLLLLGAFTTKSHAHPKEETRSLPAFSAIQLNCDAKVFVTLGHRQEVSLEAPKEIIASILTEVIKGRLVIRTKPGTDTKGFPVLINITVNDLNELTTTGSGDIIAKKAIKTACLLLKTKGSGSISANLDVQSLSMTIAGSGDISVSGRAQHSEIRQTGTGDIHGKELQSFASSINITGSGTSTVDVDDLLTVNITGSGSVFYLSDPERIHSVINGRGRLEKIAS